MATYFALVHKDPDSAIGVSFPDVPGCFGAGDTFDEAVASSIEALRLHGEGLAAAGRSLARPRSFDELLADDEVREDAREAAIIAIDYSVAAAGSVAINVDLDAGLVDALDVAARKRGISRAALLTEALREKVAG